MNTIIISPLRAEDVEAVAALHAGELRYSFNSRIGAEHLAHIYRAMLDRRDTFVGVASDSGLPVGVVSGTLDARTLKHAILHALGTRGKVRMVAGLLRHPSAILTLLEELKSRPPVKAGNHEVNACLTAIAVASTHRRLGLAARLVESLEDFFRARRTNHYWLETIVENTGARTFYRKQDFSEIATHGRTVVLLKELPIRDQT